MPDRVFANVDHHRNFGCRPLCRQRRKLAATGHDNCDIPAHQILCQCRQTVTPSKLDRTVLADDVAGLVQPLDPSKQQQLNAVTCLKKGRRK
jgi:hypothetical protein